MQQGEIAWNTRPLPDRLDEVLRDDDSGAVGEAGRQQDRLAVRATASSSGKKSLSPDATLKAGTSGSRRRRSQYRTASTGK